MLLKTPCYEVQRSKSKKRQTKARRLTISVLTLLMTLLLVPQAGNTKEKKSNSDQLPPVPDTGSPEEDFSAGGTRDDRLQNRLCGDGKQEIDKQQIVYLLGNKNREFTSSAYPTFWFYIPNAKNKMAKKAQIKFAITELKTGKKIYDQVIQETKRSEIIGIDLPKEKKYALSPGINYVWSLKVDCPRTAQESEIALEGWLSRVSLDAKLQNQLASTPETEKYAVYLKHNLLYDALNELAQRRINKPKDTQVEAAWSELLTKLGWEDLIGQKSLSVASPSWSDMKISTQKN